jgi:hypothetical protein
MHGLFSGIQLSDEAHERRQNPARFRSVKSLDGPAELFGHRPRHLRHTSNRSGSIQLRSGFSEERDHIQECRFDPGTSSPDPLPTHSLAAPPARSVRVGASLRSRFRLPAARSAGQGISL